MQRLARLSSSPAFASALTIGHVNIHEHQKWITSSSHEISHWYDAIALYVQRRGEDERIKSVLMLAKRLLPLLKIQGVVQRLALWQLETVLADASSWDLYLYLIGQAHRLLCDS